MKGRIFIILIIFMGLLGPIFPLTPKESVATLGDDFYEDFEGIVFPSWTATGLWHLEDNQKSDYPIYDWIPSGSRYMWYGSNTTGTYNTSSNPNYGWLTSEVLDVSGFSMSLSGLVTLGFWSKAETEDSLSYDKKEVNISTDGGYSWTNIGIIQDSTYWEYYWFDITGFVFNGSLMIRFIFDTVDGYANDYRGWMLDDIEIKERKYDIWIDQESEALIGETKPITFYIQSYLNISSSIFVQIFMITPSGYNNTLLASNYGISAYQNWNSTLTYTFDQEGEYQVLMVLTHGTEKLIADCWWYVYSPWFELYIWQENYASIGDTKPMDFFVESHFPNAMSVTIDIIVETPTLKESIFFDYITIPAFGIWNTSLYYTFNLAGDYNVKMIVKDNLGIEWITECWWEVSESEYFSRYIIQENFRFLGEWGNMYFLVESHFNRTINATVQILILRPDNSTEVHFNYTITFTYYSIWNLSIDYLFTQVGTYIVYLIVIDDTGREWITECWWDVRNLNTFELWIEQDNYAVVGEWRWMGFHVNSFFDHSMYVTIQIEIQAPSGGTTTLYYNDLVFIPKMFSLIVFDIDYQFNEEGTYYVHFYLIDDKDIQWGTSCRWDIVTKPMSDEPAIKIIAPQTLVVNEVLNVIIDVYAGSNDLIIYDVTLKFDNGSIIETREINYVIPAGTNYQMTFEVRMSQIGEYKLLGIVDTDQGTLMADHLVTIISAQSTTTEPTTTKPDDNGTLNITPGFEGLILIFAIIPFALISRKYGEK